MADARSHIRLKSPILFQLGEYVSLGKVEAQLKTHSLVENICVYGDPYRYTTYELNFQELTISFEMYTFVL